MVLGALKGLVTEKAHFHSFDFRLAGSHIWAIFSSLCGGSRTLTHACSFSY